jgi:SAM-dependent methyltransferase
MTEQAHPEINLKEVYGLRFDEEDALRKDAIWKEVTRYLQRFVDGAVLDLACDRGDFIRNIQAREKWATDLRDVSAHLPEDVKFLQADGLTLDSVLPTSHFDVVFMSNYLEHLPSADAVVRQFEVAREILKPGGRAIVLQPNIRLIGSAYWDFIDHRVALTEKSLVEAGDLAGLEAERVIRRFLPYTTKSRLPQGAAFVRAYLAVPALWRLLGKQTLYIGRRPAE